jgi:hypothetical protein
MMHQATHPKGHKHVTQIALRAGHSVAGVGEAATSISEGGLALVRIHDGDDLQ